MMKHGASKIARRLVPAVAAGMLAAQPLAAQQALPVDVATPLVETVVDWDEYTGRFEAVERVELRSRVSGFLESVNFREGEIVEAGTVLFVIDRRPFQAAVGRARAELAAAEAEQERATAMLRRGEQLVRDRTVTVTTLDQRRAEKLRADAQVAVAQAEIRVAELDLEFTEIRAPFKGRISDRKVDVGNLVTAGDTLLATVVSTDPIHLVFTASETDFLKYSRLNADGSRMSSRSAANPVQARLIDETGWPHKGFMNFVDNELDPNAGTVRGRATFENADDLLTPGLFARLRLIGSGEYEALLLPDAAVLSDQSRKIVMVVDGEGTVSAKRVELGPLYRGLRVIRSGLAPDDRVVISGVQRARPGGKVVPQDVSIAFPGAATN